MRTRQELEESAARFAAVLGHKMTAFQPLHEQPYIAESICEQCEAFAQVNAQAGPLGIAIGGTAVMFNCKTEDE